ncbi:hypothetical protein ACIQUG_34390 [Ensifer sp. NPDC090286]|uniref:hypothetical protein n=1 Tax=Ensifer sp. NPDC090286 TaxID=3363991 RepID=UPI00383B8335
MISYKKVRKLVAGPMASLRKSVGKAGPIAISKVPDSSFASWLAHSQTVRAFPASYPVNAIKYKEIHMWPALRFYIWLRLICFIMGKTVKGKHVINNSPGMVWRDYYVDEHNAVCVDDLDAASEPVDFVVFSNQNSVDLCEVDGVSYNRLSDPLCERLASYGSVQKIEFLKGQSPLPHNRHIVPKYILPSVVRATRYHLLVSNLSSAVPAMKRAFAEAEISEDIINFYIDEFFNMKESYKKILNEFRPRCAFFSPVDYSFPLIMACKECGVVAVDIQHGNHVGFNLPYNHWDEAPVGGYDLFPDVFLAWGSREKKAIAKTFPSTRIVTAGYPWLDYFEEKSVRGSSVVEKILAKVGKYSEVVVITLRDQVEFPPLLKAIISDDRAAEAGIVFLVKPHPKNNKLNGIPKLKNVYMPAGLKETSIPNLAPYATLHITVNSSSIFEFEYYGVPTFVFGDEPLVDYADLIEEGRLRYLKDPDDFYRNLRELDRERLLPPLIDNNSDEFDNYLIEIMARDQGRAGLSFERAEKTPVQAENVQGKDRLGDRQAYGVR